MIAARSPTSSTRRAPSVSPSQTTQSSASRLPATIGRTHTLGFSANDSCEVPEIGRYFKAVTAPFPVVPP
jgi:hypothetical protein